MNNTSPPITLHDLDRRIRDVSRSWLEDVCGKFVDAGSTPQIRSDFQGKLEIRLPRSCRRSSKVDQPHFYR